MRMLCLAVLIPALALLSLLSLRGQSEATPAAGFRALSGAEARAYAIPADVRLVHSFALEGHTYERYQQQVDGAEVLGGQLIILRAPGGTAAHVIGAHFPAVAPSNRHRLTAADARAIAAASDAPATDRRIVRLMLDPSDGRLFYRVESQGLDTRTVHWIDADSGAVINRYDAIESGTGIGVKGDVKDLTGVTSLDPADGHGAVGAHYDLISPDGRQVTYDARNRPSQLYYVTDADDAWDIVTADRQSPGHPALIDAQYYANVTDDYYQSAHGLDWLACTGLPAMQSVAHYTRNYNNAFWSGQYMVYGDGDGTQFREFSGALDIVAHELSHAVTDCTSVLIYQDESGALNESFSDIMGTSAEYWADSVGRDAAVSPDWNLGEDIMLVADAAPGFRNMADPAEDGDPDHYSERQVGGVDNGGVHTNSGIPNHAYYLLVNGGHNAGCALGHGHCAGEGAVSVTGIGLAAAEHIFLLGFSSLPDNATMCQARFATEAVAGSNAPAVADAWRAVGLTDALCLPAVSTPTPTETATLTPTPTATPTPTGTPTPSPTVTTTPSPDSDGDGCTDAEELGLQPELGGDRNPANFWDFYDVTGERQIDLSDTLLILAHFGHGPADDALDHLLDREAPDINRLYRTEEALPDSSGVDLSDALINLASFGHSCIGP